MRVSEVGVVISLSTYAVVVVSGRGWERSNNLIKRGMRG